MGDVLYMTAITDPPHAVDKSRCLADIVIRRFTTYALVPNFKQGQSATVICPKSPNSRAAKTAIYTRLREILDGKLAQIHIGGFLQVPVRFHVH